MVNLTLLGKLEKIPLPKKFASLNGQKILVTGAAGFIGGALFKRLMEYDLNVLGTVLYQEEAEQLRERGYQVEVLDLASDADWTPILSGIDTVFNIAAMFQEVENDESMYFKVNVDGTVKLLKQAGEAGVSRFVHCSTVGVHGHVKEIPCTENSPYNPMDEYHRSKLQGELEVLELAKGLPADSMIVTVNRPAMVYGPGDIRMMKIFKTIAEGKFLMIGSGETLAHLGYIDDQVDSLLLSGVMPRENVHLESFNIASGTHIKLNRLAEVIAQQGNYKLSRIKIPITPVWYASWLCEIICQPFNIKPPIFRRRVGFFTHNRSFDLSKARDLLGYSQYTTVEQGVETTLNWYKTHGLINAKSADSSSCRGAPESG